MCAVLEQCPNLTLLDLSSLLSRFTLEHFSFSRSENSVGAAGATSIAGSRLVQPAPYNAATISGIDCKLNAADVRLASLPREVRSGFFTDALRYINELNEGFEQSYRHKVMLVGHQAVGKTSLLHAMFPLAAMYKDSVDASIRVVLQGSQLVLQMSSTAHSVLDLTPDTFALEPPNSDHPYQIRIVALKNAARQLHVLEFSASEMDTALATKDISHYPITTSLTLTFSSATASSYIEWRRAVEHWTANTATSGIDTRRMSVKDTRLWPQPQVPRLDLCFMDFAGQEEFVCLSLTEFV